jgi:hypothetical protein
MSEYTFTGIIVGILLGLSILSSSCTTPPRPISECRQLCLNDKVESFKDELQECRCRGAK